MITHFYSDPHFGHENIIRLSSRPFVSLEHMHDSLIRRYNEVVSPDDFVLWCGDASMKISPDAVREILFQLNGRKGLVRGNHDPKSFGKCLRMGFSWVVDELFVHMAGRTCRVKHYPYALTERQKAQLRAEGKHVDERYPERRPPRVDGEILIHGHTHQNNKRNGNQIHVGVDSWGFAPVPWAEVEKIVALV